MERLVPCQSRLYRFIASLVPDRADAEDLFQKTCITAWKERETFDPSRDLFPWLCGIGRNHVRHHYRSRRGAPIALAPDVVEQLADLKVEEAGRDEARQRALDDCLRGLSPQDRKMLEAYYGDRRPVRSLATALGRSADALFKTLQRLRAGLYDCVNSKMSEDIQP